MKRVGAIGLIALGVLISSEVKGQSDVENVLFGEEGQHVLEKDDRYKTLENTVGKDSAKKVVWGLMTRFFKRRRFMKNYPGIDSENDTIRLKAYYNASYFFNIEKEGESKEESARLTKWLIDATRKGRVKPATVPDWFKWEPPDHNPRVKSKK